MSRLGFRKKLLLMAIVPVLGILAFGAATVDDKLDQRRVARAVLVDVEILKSADSAVDALQRERGMRAGRVAQKEDEAASLRAATNRALATLADSRERCPRCALLPARLAAIRAQESGEGTLELIAAHSQLIDEILGIAEGLVIDMPAAGDSARRLAYSALSLGRVVEAVSQQRALLSEMLEDQDVSLKGYQDLAIAQAEYERNLGRFRKWAPAKEAQDLEVVLAAPARTQVSESLVRVQRKFRVAEQVSHVRRFIGFEGLIHDFKNYVLRGGSEYRQHFLTRYALLLQHLGHVDKLAEMAEDKALVSMIGRAFAEYRRNLDVVRDMRTKGESAAIIDAAVQVDDESVTRALIALESRPLGIDRLLWEKNSRDLLTSIALINERMLSHLVLQAQRVAHRATTLAITYVAVVLLALGITGMLIAAALKQVALLAKVTSHIEGIAQGRYDDEEILPVSVSGSDEISGLSRAYNVLRHGLGQLGERSAMVVLDRRSASATLSAQRGQSENLGPTIATSGPFAEAFSHIEERYAQLGKMAECIANDQLESPILQEHFEGRLGESIAKMTESLQRLAAHAEAIAKGSFEDRREEEASGTLGTAFAAMTHSLRTLARQVRAIASGDLENPILEEQVPGEVGAAVQEMAKDLQHMKQQLVVSERMSSMGMLAAGIGHEMNNPMTYVLGNLEWIREQLSAGVAVPEMEEAIDETLEGVRRVCEITADLNLFTRPHQGTTASVDARAIMESALRVGTAHLRGVVALHREFGEVSNVLVHKGKLGQVFLNLLINASQAITSEGGKGNITIKMSEEGGRVSIDIADDGPGIPESSLERIFEPFYSTKDSAGTGLGLAICRQIITDFGGEICAFNSDEGAVFRVSLPSQETNKSLS